MNKSAQIGDHVLYCLDNGQVRPAVVVQSWNGDLVNLQVSVDGTNDQHHEVNPTGVTAEEAARGVAWRTSRHRSDEPKRGYWHWPVGTA